MRDKILKRVNFFIEIYLNNPNDNNFQKIKKLMENLHKFKNKINRIFNFFNVEIGII